MFTDGYIWAKMLELKVFRPEDVVNALNPPRGFRKWVKQKTHSLITSQAKNGLLRRLVENPPVFATVWASEEDIKTVMKSCPICGKLFIPHRSDNLYCSEGCRKLVKNEKVRQKRRMKGVGAKKRRWTQDELNKLQELVYRRATTEDYERLAKELSRTKEAIKSKVKELRRLAHAT